METKYSKHKNIIGSIINHFKDRRNTSKKSLIRKRWHINKSTDKYLTNTFRKREREKIKTRKNNQNKEESLKKIEEAEKSCKTYIISILEYMIDKEIANKELMQIEEFIFNSECDKAKKIEIPNDRIKENNIIKENIEKNVKLFDNKINTKPPKENKPINVINNPKINKEPININNNKNNINLQNSKLNQSIDNNKKSNSAKVDGMVKPPEKRLGKNNKNKNNGAFPSLSLRTLLDDNYDNIRRKNNNLKLRIRFNRNNKITIDRYIQEKNDLNPFHDNYNDVLNNYKIYDIYKYNYLDDKNFENLFNSYNMSKIKDLNLLEDSDEDSTDLNNDIKHFSTSYKQYLKLKRSHS